MIAQKVEGKWKTEVIGGEVRPEVQSCLWNDPPCTPAGQDFAVCVQRTHASWLLNQGVFSNLSGKPRERAIAAARSLGYEIFVSQADITPVFSNSDLQATLRVCNTGVAPFYYDWKVQVGVLDATRKRVRDWDTDWKLTRVLPGERETIWNLKRGGHGLKPGRYTLVMRVVNPLQKGRPFQFANTAQNQDAPGWLSVGAFTVRSSSRNTQN